MSKVKEQKEFQGTCDPCLQELVDGTIHCWKWVNVMGLTGWSGCHEFFAADDDSYKLHVAKTGGCRNPAEIDKLKWNGVSWEVKEEDDRRRRPARTDV